MDPRALSAFDATLTDRAAEAFGIDELDPTPLPAFENFVHEGGRFGESVILRLSHHARRPRPLIEAEVAFVRHLSARGLPVAEPLCAVDGSRVVSLDTSDREGAFSAVLFERAPGRVLAGAPKLRPIAEDPALLRTWGRLTAQMHEAAAGFEGADARPRWIDCAELRPELFGGPPDLSARASQLRAVVAERLLVSDDSRLIHGDLTTSNFTYAAGRITVFDFDNCTRAPTVRDIAVGLSYWLRASAAHVRADAARHFLTHFLEGYRTVRLVDFDPLLFRACAELERIDNWVLLATAVSHRADQSERKERARLLLEEIRAGVPALTLEDAWLG